jgi:hypothetical protein
MVDIAGNNTRIFTKGFWDFVIVRNILGDIVLDPKANENAKRLVWTALENWDKPCLQKAW